MTTVPLDARRKVGLLHAIAVGAAVVGFLFVLLWAGDALGFIPATHRFVSVFTTNPETSSVSALAEGLPLAVAFGALTGALLAIFSNLLNFLQR
jgi:hypothetical protein